ncbi:MAG: hypothetical protein AAF975_04935, partial [Spirochaetota bacterium]
GELFAFLANGNLGRFNMDLELLKQSDEALLPEFAPRFAGAYVLLENEQDELLWLDVSSLERKGVWEE